MLRHVVKPSAALLRQASTRRSFAAAATSRQKRALNEEQLKGAGSSTKPPAAAAAPTASAGGDGGGGGGSALPVMLVVAAGAAGAAYYNDMIPGLGGEKVDPVPEAEKEAPAVEAKKEEAPKEEAPEKEEEKAPVEAAAEEAPASSAEGNRVLQIALPEGSKRSDPPAAVTDHPFGGNKVAMQPPASKSENSPTADAALKELQSELSKETKRTLDEAHSELAKLSSLDMSELDSMTTTQLKVRLVQLAKDMEERTKWEAVRLKEFLAMKEKEVENKYVLLMKKQRLEAENLMDTRLKEQNKDLTAQAQAALEEKEATMQSIMDNSLKIQEKAFNDEKDSFVKKAEEASDAKFEELFGKSLAQAKDAFAKKMEQKVAQMEALTKKLSDLEFALQATKDFQSGSVQAHRMSAAAMALVDTLESSKPAGSAMEALKAVAEDNSVVNAAIASLPPNVAKRGVSTLQELQTRFEEQTYGKCRRAAMVPEGQSGVEGQLLGMMFASLKFAPSPDDVAPEGEKDDTEFVLSRARRHVQLGELEEAIEEMKKLTGQVAFTAKDWSQLAQERVTVEKALKVIRMECVLANESMSKHPGSN